MHLICCLFTVAYSFVWLGAKVVRKIISWLDSDVKFQPALNFTAEIQINSCLGIAVGNNDNLYRQSQDCSIPLSFLCKRAAPGK